MAVSYSKKNKHSSKSRKHFTKTKKMSGGRERFGHIFKGLSRFKNRVFKRGPPTAPPTALPPKRTRNNIVALHRLPTNSNSINKSMAHIEHYLNPIIRNSTLYLPSSNFEPFKSKDYVFNPDTEYSAGTNGPHSISDENQRLTHINKEMQRKKNYISNFTKQIIKNQIIKNQTTESNAG